nr:MAG TPA: YopX protein [Bacteriophage sp.]
MNRENLFKAKRKDNGEWVEGYKVKYPSGKVEIFKKCVELPDVLLRCEVDPKTICEYTELKDKNGKEIWRNDILRGHKNNDDLVRVAFGEFNVIDAETLEVVDRVIGWHTEVIETDALSKCEPFCLPMPLTDFYIERSEFEVYGNIFDNPELLEVE